MTKIMSCDCKSQYQDKLYGKGKRVHNAKISKQGSPTNWRCTVCGKEKA